MSRPATAPSLTLSLILAAGGALGAGEAAAQSSRTIPVEHDLRRFERLEDRIESRGTGSLGPYSAPYSGPYVPGTGAAAPDVPGFDGPPGILRDSVGNSGPLPPGSPVNSGNE